jgi:hypothetical protein
VASPYTMRQSNLTTGSFPGMGYADELAAWPARLPPASGLGPAPGRLPDHRGGHHPARRQPGDHGLGRDHAAGAPVRPDAGSQPDDVDQLGRRLGDHAAVRPQSRHRRRRA